MKRPITTIHTTSHFARQFRRLPPEIQDAAEARERLFRADAFDPRLRTHKLSGALEGNWAFPVTHSIRIVFKFLRPDEVLFYSIGPHEIVYR